MKSPIKILFFLAFAVISSGGCNNDDAVAGFEMVYTRDFEIFAGLNTFETHNFRLPNFSAQYASRLAANGLTKADISDVLPRRFLINNISGNITFNDLQRARLFISKTDGTLEREIAFLEPVPSDIGYQMDLVPTLATVAEILDTENFDLILKLNYRSVSSQSVDARITVVFQAMTK